jgi:hypothetical protein
MKVRFADSGSGRPILNVELGYECLPRRNEMVVIGDVVYECTGVKHAFGGVHGYPHEIEIQIKPIR